MYSQCDIGYSIPAKIAMPFSFLTLPMTHEGEVARLANTHPVMCISRRREAGGSTSMSWKSLQQAPFALWDLKWERAIFYALLNRETWLQHQQQQYVVDFTGNGGVSALDSIPHFHLVRSTPEAENQKGEFATISHLLLPQRELAPAVGLFLLMCVCPPTTDTRARASQAGTARGEKNRL